MGVDHAGHQGRAHAVDDGGAHAARRHAGAAETGAAAGHLLDAVALYQHLARIGIFARRIEDADIGEEHGFGLAAVRSEAGPVLTIVGHDLLLTFL